MIFHNILCVAFVSVLLTGCATSESGKTLLLAPQVGGVGIADIQTLEVQAVSNGVQTAKSGDILCTQVAQMKAAYTLNKETKVTSLGGLGIIFKAGTEDLFFPLITQNHGEIYCSVEGLGKETIVLGLLKHRMCLKDKDGDGLFDRAWAMDEVGNFIGATSGYVYDFTTDIEPPVGKTKAETVEIPTQKFAVQYKYNSGLFSSRGSLNALAVVEKSNGKSDLIDALDPRDGILPKEGKFPLTYTIAGVDIQIIDHKDKTLTYKILDTPQVGDHVFFARPRKPVTTYVYY